MANALEWAVAAAIAWAPVSSACSAVAVSQVAYGAAAAAIFVDDTPSHAPLVSSVTTAR